MSDQGIKWTDEQRKAIESIGRDIFVTASAGTGKTAVLSERCLHIISKESKDSVWDFLVLTFTEAAAEEMKNRIGENIRKAYLGTRDEHLKEQMMLLQGSDISTIHSFCKRIIGEYFYELKIDPAFGIIDGDEQMLLKAEMLEKTVKWAWEQEDVRQGLEILLKGRNLRINDGFLCKIIPLSDKLNNLVNRDSWFEEAKNLAGMGERKLAEGQRDLISEIMDDAVGQLEFARSIVREFGPDDKWEERFNREHFGPVSELRVCFEQGKWDEFVKAVLEFKKAKNYKPKEVTDEIAELVKKTVEGGLGDLMKLRDLAAFNPAYLEEFDRAAGLEVMVLLRLLEKFEEFYSEAKAEINSYDFSDLEHFALKLLTVASDEGLKPSGAAMELRKKYKHIFVDEYQDINPVQREILRAVCCGDNMFVVGDVKQSIYEFRGADCQIFLENLKRASGDGDGEGERIDLFKNFRSKKGVLDFVNEVFGVIMRDDVCELSYGEGEMLVSGKRCEGEKAGTGGDGVCAELLVVDEDSEDEEDLRDSRNLTGRQKQALILADKIKGLIGQGYKYSDMVVVMRSPAGRANEYVEVFKASGVPVSSQSCAGYFEATEVTDCVNLLKVLDNPYQDIEFAAVLRSPFFGVTDSELMKIRRGSDRESHFYNYVREYIERGDDRGLSEKLMRAVEKFEEWRKAGRRGKLADMLWNVYRETGYLAFVQALPNGKSRKANLLKLHEKAIKFEGFVSGAGVPSLSRFVMFLEKLLEAGVDWTPAEPEGTAEDAVRIMSIHQSKGLEFPVVFLAETDSKFNRTDVDEECLFDRDMTLGLKVFDKENNCKLASVNHQVIANRKLKTLLAEEMRVLYVALTRAKEKLIVVGRKGSEKAGRLVREAILSGRDSAWRIKRVNNYLDWILYSLAGQAAVRSELGIEVGEADERRLVEAKFYAEGDIENLAGIMKRVEEGVIRAAERREGERVLAEIKERIFDRGVRCEGIPAKQSVSDITHSGDEYVKLDFSRAFERRPVCLDEKEERCGAVIGTAVHLVMAELDIRKRPGPEDVERKIRELVEAGAVSEEVSERIDAGQLVRFFDSEPGRMLFEDGVTVRREWPFTIGLGVKEWAELAGMDGMLDLDVRRIDGELIVVQGIVDIMIEDEDGVVVIDLKTDNAWGEEVSRRAEGYRKQVDIYGMAAEMISGKGLRGKWLYFTRSGESVRF